MKTIFTLLSGIVLLYSQAYSQGCSSSVDANAVVINNQQQINDAVKKYWVCDGGVLILTGDRNTIWVDDGGILSLTGDSNQVYAKENTTITIAENYNFVDIDVKVIQAGNYTDNGVNTTKKNCDPMVFDYTVAPSGGCATTGLSEITFVKDAKVYPSPADTKLFVQFPEPAGNSYVLEVFDASGKLVLSDPNAITTNSPYELDVSTLSTGIYTLHMRSSNTLVNKQISISR